MFINDFVRKNVLRIFRLSNGYPLNTPLSGCGLILAFHRVVEECFSIYNNELEISVAKLDLLITHLKKNNYEFIAIDDLAKRLDPKASRKFVVFTFDDGYLDNYTLAYPIFKKHGVPFTIYVSTSFPDGQALIWWYALEKLVAENNSVEFNGVILPSKDQLEKLNTYRYLHAEIKVLCTNEKHLLLPAFFLKHGLDIRHESNKLALSWGNIDVLNRDPLVTIGAHTVNHLALSKQSDEDAFFDIMSGKKRLEEKLVKKIAHFAYPFGSRAEVDMKTVLLSEKAGFLTSTTTLMGNLHAEHADHLHSLPRYVLNESISPFFFNLYLNGSYAFLVNNYKKINYIKCT